MAEDVAALDRELDRLTNELGTARRRCRDSRPGVADPATALRALGRTQQTAYAFWEDHQPDLARVDQLGLVDFLRSFVLAATQFLEYGQQLPRLPDPDGDGWLDHASSRDLRLSQGQAVVTAAKLLTSADLPRFVHLEAKGAVLRSAQHALPELEPLLPVLATELLAECAATEASGDPDPIDLIPFTRVTALSVLAPHDSGAEQQLLAVDPESLNDPLAAWNLVVGQLLRARVAEPAGREAILRRFTDAVDWALEHLSAPQRLARRATAEQQVLRAVAELITVDRPAAIRLLDELGRLCGFSASGPGTLHLFAAADVLHAVLRGADPADSTLVTHPIPRAEWALITQAVDAGSEEDAFSSIRKVVKPLLRDPSLSQTPSIELDPSSLVSWWPWHIVHAGDGPLGLRNDLRWRTRRRDHSSVTTTATTTDTDPTPALVVDTVFPQAASVITAWEQHLGGRVLRYDSRTGSSRNADLPRQVLELMSRHEDVTYFGHAVSDPLSVDQSGLVLADDLLISLADLEGLRTPPTRVTLVACESGRSNLMLAGVSPAHSLAAAGTRQVIGTLWPIEARLGLDYLQRLFTLRASHPGLERAWRQISRTKKDSVAAFMFLGSTDL